MGPFVKAYITAALFAETDNADESGGEPLDTNYTIEDIASDTMSKMIADCVQFQAENEEDLDQAGDDAQAGHDFWLTRNGHGAGFWDGDYPQELGERLTAASKNFGEVSLYVGDDGRIHQM